jgi:hypothetical protein
VSSEYQTTSVEGLRAGGAGDATAGLLVARVAIAVVAGAEARAVEVPLAGPEARAAELFVAEVPRAKVPGVGALLRRILCILSLVLAQLWSGSLTSSESPLSDRLGGMEISERNWYVESIKDGKVINSARKSLLCKKGEFQSVFFFSRLENRGRTK